MRLPPNQQLITSDKWPFVGEKEAASGNTLWTVTVNGLVQQQKSFSLEQLAGLPQTQKTLDVHCVTRWSKYDMAFSGVLLKDLLNICKVDPAANFISFVARSDRNHSSSLPIGEAIELETLIVTHYRGEPLPNEHGGPVRSVVPRKYFYKSVKWLETIELLAEDRLGYWEADAGYHNSADPWQEQRFMASNISKRRAVELIDSKDFTSGDLRGIDASNRELNELNAQGALLRDSNFCDCTLLQADFRESNLSGARFRNANLTGSNFQGSDIEGADFSGADLRDVNFEGCSFFGASFCDVLEDGSCSNGATIDQTTVFFDSQLEALTPEQATYLRQRAE